MSLLANSNAIESGGYNIDRSLRFRSSASAYLNRTPASASNRRTFTWSGWVKRGASGDGTGSNHFFLCSADDGAGGSVVDFYANTIRIYFSGGSYLLQTTQVFRDYSAWFHIVVAIDTTQATSTDRVKLYINGSQVTEFSTSVYPTQNLDTAFNAAVSHYICKNTATNYFDGYLAEVNFIDGQALTPSSFGETSTETGVWVPKKYTGTYGTNGFYLDFKDNTSATTLAYDKSGNGNNWTANNISTTAGSTYDSMLDVPTLTSATAANYCVLSPVDISPIGGVMSQGNLQFVNSNGGAQATIRGTIGVSSGKWYWETQQSVGSSNYPDTGILNLAAALNVADQYVGYYATGYSYRGNGTKGNNNSSYAYATSYTTSDLIGVALDMDAGTLTFYKNGTSLGTAFTGLSGTFAPAVSCYGGGGWYLNCGQRPFSYTPPTGFKALNTFNLPDPTIKKPNQYFDCLDWTGNNTSGRTFTGLQFSPDLVWTKVRSAAYAHGLYDTSRGTTKKLSSNSTGSEVTDTQGLQAFTSNGYTIGNDAGINESGQTYVGWQWKESATAGFDIVTYTGNGSNGQTVAHNLGVTPKMVILKGRSSALDWIVYHAGTANPTANNLWLNLTSAVGNNSGFLTPSSSNITFTTSYGANNPNGVSMVAYLFAEIPGFSKFGSYTGNGSSDGPFVYCGFRPKYVMIKIASGATDDWTINDASRNPYNVSDAILYPNSSSAEGVGSGAYIDFTSNGFKIRNNNQRNNGSGYTYIYAAFAENPFKYSNAR